MSALVRVSPVLFFFFFSKSKCWEIPLRINYNGTPESDLPRSWNHRSWSHKQNFRHRPFVVQVHEWSPEMMCLGPGPVLAIASCSPEPVSSSSWARSWAGYLSFPGSWVWPRNSPWVVCDCQADPGWPLGPSSRILPLLLAYCSQHKAGYHLVLLPTPRLPAVLCHAAISCFSRTIYNSNLLLKNILEWPSDSPLTMHQK